MSNTPLEFCTWYIYMYIKHTATYAYSTASGSPCNVVIEYPPSLPAYISKNGNMTSDVWHVSIETLTQLPCESSPAGNNG